MTESVIKQIANEYAKRGVNVDIVYDENGHNGQWNPKTNTVTVNLAANNPLAAFFHETSHMVKQYSGEYWNDISLMCITYLAKANKTSISELADIKKKLYQTENEEFVNEELVSDAVSLIAQDKQAVRKLYSQLLESGKPKGRVQKILDKFKEVLMRLRTHFIKLGKSFNTNIEAVGMSEISGFSSYVNELSEGLSTAINELETYGEDEKVKFSVRESEKYTFDTAHNSFTDYKADTKNNLKLRNIEIVDNENQLENIISNALDNRQSKNNYCLGAVSDDLLTKIKGDIGENIFKNGQYSFIISSDDIRHIQEHFKDTKDIKQAIFRLCDTVNNYDTVKLDKQGNRNLLVFEKSYSDYNYLSVELASKKNRSIDLITFYVTLNNKKRVLLNSSAENNTATRGEYNSSNNSISQNDTVVNDSISENGENNINKFYTIASNSKYAKVGEYNHFSLSAVKRLIKEGQQFRKKYESYKQFAYSNEYDQYSLLEHQIIGFGFDNPDIDANSLTVKKYLRIGEPQADNLTYLNSYNNAEDKREDGVSVITSGWLKSLKSVFFGSSDEKLASRGVYEIEGIDLSSRGGDDEVLIYPVSWAKKTNIKSRKKLEAAVKYLEESQNSEQDTKFSLKEDTTNWKPITPTEETQKVLNRLANNEHVSLETIQMLEEIREAYTRRGDYEPTVNINTPSRQELRQKIQDDVEKLGSARLDENGEWVYDNNIRKEKRIDVVIGLPAAGKSSAIADPLSNRYGSRIVDCDIVKERLPEFDNGYGADNVHDESKLINDNILDRAMENGENIVLPIVGSGYNKLEQKLQSYKDRGYNVHLHLNELPMNKSLGRMLNRFLETGRFLEPLLAYKYQNKPTEVFNRIIAERGDLLNGYSHYSNDVKRGEKPIFIKGTERVEKTIDAGRNEGNRRENLGISQGRLTETSEAEALIKKYSLMEDVDIKAAQAAIKANQELEKQVKLAGKLFKKAGTVLDYKSVQQISNELLRKYRFSGDTDMRNYITEKLYAFYTYATSEDADDGSAYAYAREIGEDIEKVNGVDIESSEFGEEMSDIIALDISSKYTETAILKSPEEYTKETDRLRESLRQEKAKTNKNDEAILKLTKDLKTAVSNFHSAVETKQKYKSEVYELKRKLVQTENKLAKQKQSYEKKIAKLRSNKSKKKANAVEQLRPPQKKFRNLETIQLVAEHGAYEQNEESSRDIFVPKKDKQGKVISKSVKTVVESDYVSDSAVSAINHAMLEGAMSHEVKTNKSAQKAADRIFERQGYEGAYKEFVSRIELSKEFANNGPDMVALGARLLQEAKERGDDTAAADITANLAVYALLGGRVTQSYNMLRACGATGQALFFERFVKNRNIANEKEWAKKWSVNAKEKYLGKTSEFKPLVLNEELMKKLVVATEQEDIDSISTEIMLDIADQVPSTAGEKIQAWRYFSMLFNPTTHIRNVTGNAVFATVRQGQNVIKTGLEQALNKATGGKIKLTTSIVVSKEYRDFAKADWNASRKTAMMSGKFNLENFITQNKKLYKHKIFNATIEKAIKWNSNMLEKEDGIFMKLAYTQALGRYLQVNNISLEENSNAELEAERQRQLAEARANAFMEAETATFRNANAIATALTQLSNQNAAFNLMVNSIMPFKKTPANIFLQSMRYSPIGIGMGIKQIVWDGVKGQKTANEIIDTFASGLTGTGIFLLGMLLRKLGILQGLFGDDDILNDEQGLQENSITICGYTFTIDWSAPMVVPLMMGAEWADSFGDFKIDGKLTDNVWQLVSQSVDPLINMTMLEGVNNILTSIKYSQDNAISDIAIKTGTNFISQFVPTIGGKIAQTVSDSRKRTYIDKNKSETLQTVVQGVQKKTPVWYDSLQPYLDAWGQEDKENVASKILQNFVLPGYLQKVESDTATDLVLEVYEQSGHDKTVVPKTPAKYFTMYELEKVDGKEKSVKGEKINLTGEQYTTLARTQGNMSHALVTALADNSTFNNMDISQKVAVLDNVYDFAKYLGRYAVDNNYSGTSTEKWCRELVNSKKKKTEEQIINTILKRSKE